MEEGKKENKIEKKERRKEKTKWMKEKRIKNNDRE